MIVLRFCVDIHWAWVYSNTINKEPFRDLTENNLLNDIELVPKYSVRRVMCWYNNDVIVDGGHTVLSARQQGLLACQVHCRPDRRDGRKCTRRADNHCLRVDNTASHQSYNHVIIIMLPGNKIRILESLNTNETTIYPDNCHRRILLSTNLWRVTYNYNPLPNIVVIHVAGSSRLSGQW